MKTTQKPDVNVIIEKNAETKIQFRFLSFFVYFSLFAKQASKRIMIIIAIGICNFFFGKMMTNVSMIAENTFTTNVFFI